MARTAGAGPSPTMTVPPSTLLPVAAAMEVKGSRGIIIRGHYRTSRETAIADRNSIPRWSTSDAEASAPVSAGGAPSPTTVSPSSSSASPSSS